MDPISMSASFITIAGLATQAVSTVQKSYDLYSSVKGAPEDLRSLLRELQLLGTLLAGFRGIAAYRTDGSTGGFVTALASCRDALESIQAFSADLETSISKAKRGLRQWAAFKVTFQETKLKGHLNRLERAKSMLSLAHQICLQSQIMHVARQQQQSPRKPPDGWPEITDHFQAHGQPGLCKSLTEQDGLTRPISDKPNMRQRRLKQRYVIRSYNLYFGLLSVVRSESDSTINGKLRTATANGLMFQPIVDGMLRSGFSLLRERSLGAWQYSLRTFSTFTTGDAICQYCVSGDLLGAKELCRQGRASPYDVTNGGFTLLHIAATHGRADMCQWLLELGVDAGTTASLSAADDDGARLMVFDAGATPLHLAAQCSGMRYQTKSGGSWIPDAVQYLDTNSQQRPKEYLDTIRVLVENGADPMAVDVNGDTALHVDTGGIEQFHYLLQQEYFVTECSQLNFGGDTIAERHARFFWDHGPQRASLAWEHEKTRKRGFHSYGLKSPPPFPVTSKVLLLHETAAHLRYFATRDNRDFDSALALVRKLVEDGVDIHSPSREHPEYKRTPLAQIPRITGEHDIGPNGLDKERQVIHSVLQAWLGTLVEANVELGQYIREEEEIIQSTGIDRRWQLYEDDPEWEYGVNWAFRHSTEGDSPSISVQYILRPIPQKSMELDEVLDPETDCGDVPGAWVEESR